MEDQKPKIKEENSSKQEYKGQQKATFGGNSAKTIYKYNKQ